MHLLIWSPLETWAERFHMGETGDHPRVPRMGRILARSRLVQWVARGVMAPVAQWAFRAWGRMLDLPAPLSTLMGVLAAAGFAAGVVFAGWKAAQFAFAAPLTPVSRQIPWALLMSFLRVTVGVGLAVVLSIPLAYVTFRRARVRQTVPVDPADLRQHPRHRLLPADRHPHAAAASRDERGVHPARPHGDLLLCRLQRPVGSGEPSRRR